MINFLKTHVYFQNINIKVVFLLNISLFYMQSTNKYLGYVADFMCLYTQNCIVLIQINLDDKIKKIHKIYIKIFLKKNNHNSFPSLFFSDKEAKDFFFCYSYCYHFFLNNHFLFISVILLILTGEAFM